nr:immunoglobulin light chain junction region [Macaca mulatta]
EYYCWLYYSGVRVF